MDSKRILQFIRELAVNNNRDWFQANRAEYDIVRADFANGVSQLIGRIAAFDPAVASSGITAKACLFRINRDTRFSPDKAPYKRHFGAFITPKGTRTWQGGYYIHLEWDRCMVAFGPYYLLTPTLTECREKIEDHLSEWKQIVEAPKFIHYFGRVEECQGWSFDEELPERGFGGSRLKTCPKGFDMNSPALPYLRLKDYIAWRRVPMDYFQGDTWLDEVEDMCRTVQPMLAFTNDIIRHCD